MILRGEDDNVREMRGKIIRAPLLCPPPPKKSE